jgi:hypothetical protein
MKALISILVLICAASSCLATTGPLSPEMNHLREEGFNALFNMNYAKARVQFEQMITLDPKHPAGYVNLANSIWQKYLASLRRHQTNDYNKGTAFYKDEKEGEDEVDQNIDQAFQDNINKAILHAEAQLAANKNNIDAIYYLGLARNISAGYQATVKRSFFAALKSGSKGVNLHREVLEKDPAFTDAALSVGMYEYITGSLPWGVKILAFLGGVHGSKKEGLKLLESVYKDGNYAKDEAATILLMLYNREERLDDCVKLLNELSAKYPGNFFFALEKASTFSQLKQYRESNEEFEGLLHNTEAMAYMSDLIHFQYAESLVRAEDWDRAYEQYEAAAKAPTAPAPLVTIANLQAGQCLDVLGKREEAKSKYEFVLKRRDFMDSRDLAEKYLDEPYRPSEKSD